MGDFKMGSKTVMSQSGTSNPTWGANAPTGAVLRVISVSKASNFSTTETSFQTITGLTQAITLSSSSNKVFVMASFPLVESSGAASGDAITLGLFRDSTQIMEVVNLGYSNDNVVATGVPMNILDSPGVSTEVTYAAKIKSRTGSTVQINPHGGGSLTIATLTLMEVKA
tara:strand:+ start:40 stop:546 length:507 start_codon:yes stop_codon:yes gene_type:complete